MDFQDKLGTSYPVNMPPKHGRAAAMDFVHVTLGIWLGIYAFRAFMPTAVWNLSDALPLFLKGAVAIGVHLVGVAGCMLPVSKHRRAPVMLAFAVALTGIARQVFIASDVLGSALSLAGWILWLWWLAAVVRRTGSDRAPIIAAAFATAFVLQVGMQAAWHGLDLPMARGAAAIGCATLLNMVFAWTAQARAATMEDQQADGATRVFAALGIALFLELTLLANVGRIGVISQTGLLASALLIQAGLLAGLVIGTFPQSRLLTYAALVFLPIAAMAAPRITGAGTVLIVLAQASTIITLVASTTRRSTSLVRPFVAGALGLFVLIFLFYNAYEWPVLWPIAAGLLALCALPVRPGVRVRPAFAALAFAGVLLTISSMLTGDRRLAASPRAGTRILSYNIHQGFDAAGVPAMQNIADEIAATDADVVALQEVGRGWTFVGGADLISYLKYRFPDYDVHFVPVNGQLWGVALMSRLPLSDPSGHVFDAPPRTFRYGVAEGSVRMTGVDVRVASVHLTAGLEGNGGDARVEQVDQLLRKLNGYDNVIIAGDLNTHPDEPPLQRILRSGYIDAGAAAGLGALSTWPAHAADERIDYVFLRGTLNVAGGQVIRTTASDHLPVLLKVVTEHRDGKP